MDAPESIHDLRIEPITKQHIVKKFDCAQADINIYIHRFAKKSMMAGFGRTYVAVRPGQQIVLAYYTLSAYAIDASRFHNLEGCPKNISVALLGRIGVDKSIQRQGLAQILMAHAFNKAVEASEAIGIHAIFLTAKDRRLAKHYEKYGFVSLPDDKLNMYLAIETLKRAT